RQSFRDRRAKAIKAAHGRSRDTIVASLETERRPARARNLGAARAASPVRRKDRQVVGEGKYAVPQRVIGRPRELVREIRTEQVDARDLSDEERPAREQVLRIIGTPQIRDEVGDVLGRVSRRRNKSDSELANAD